MRRLLWRLRSYLPWTDEHRAYAVRATWLREAMAIVDRYVVIHGGKSTPIPAGGPPRDPDELDRLVGEIEAMLRAIDAIIDGRPDVAREWVVRDDDA